MKILHIPAKINIEKLSFDNSLLPTRIGIVSTVQYIDSLGLLKEHLESKGCKVVNAGQILGCRQENAVKVRDEVDAFLYMGTGEFHPIGLALNTGKDVFVLNPGNMKISKVNVGDIEKLKKKKKGMLTKFLSSMVIGVLISTKKGQDNVQGGAKSVKEIEKKYKDKEFYYFLCETLDFKELDNFPFIECWLNTMCPRMMDDLNVVNLEDLSD